MGVSQAFSFLTAEKPKKIEAPFIVKKPEVSKAFSFLDEPTETIDTKVNTAYRKLKAAETLGEKDPWIRTRVIPKKGSSAYGEAQITRTLSKDYLDRGKFKDIPEIEKWVKDKFIPHSELLLKHGRMKGIIKGYDPKYDYGGTGDFSEQDKIMYERMGKTILRKKIEEKPDIDIPKFWHGTEPSKEYRKKYEEGKNILSDFLIPSAEAATGGFRGAGASGDWSTLSQKWEGSKAFQAIQGWTDKMTEKFPFWLEQIPSPEYGKYGDQKTTRAAQAIQTAAALGTIGIISANIIQTISQAVSMNKALKGMENITSNLPKIENILTQKGIKLPENMSSLNKIKVIAGMTRQSPTLGTILKAASMRPAQVPAPYIVGQMVKFGDQIGKITNITGNTAQLLTAAGQTISASLSQLTPKAPPTGQITPKKGIEKPSIEQIKPLIEKEGAEWVGVQKAPGMEDMAAFTDPETKSTLYMPLSEITPESIKAHMEESRAKFKEPVTEPLIKEITPKRELLQEIKPFINFESKTSSLPLLDRQMNEINGLRLSGKLTPQQANIQIQEIKKRKLDYAREKGIAITKTQSGKTRIAIRKSGFYAKKEIETAPIRDVYSQFQSPSGMALMQDGYEKGKDFGIIYKEVWMPTKKSVAESIDFKNKFDNELKALLKKHNFPITKKSGIVLSDMLEEKVKIPGRYKELTKDIRQYMDDKRNLANDVRVKMGKSKIGYIENYIPHIQETSIWNELVGNDVTITDNFDFIIPNQVKNPFAYRRLMKEMMNPERNFFNLVERYNSAIAKDMYINPAIENIKAYNTVLKDKGLFKASKFWDEYIRTGLLGKQHKIDSALSISPVVRKGLKKWKDILNKAFLTGKISWNIATQPLSYISLTPTEAGFGNTIKAVFKMFNRGIRQSVREHSISLKIKSKDILSDAIGEGRGYANRIYRTKIDKWNDMISVISSVEEQLLHQASYIAGLDRAKELRYTGEDAYMFADLCAERTQSMYNKENRALILNSDITTAAVPFQSFATELSNHAKEILTKTKGAMRLNARQRIGKLIRLLIGIWLGNQYAKALTGREKTTVGTFIPFAGETVDRLISKVTKKGYVTTRSPVSVIQQADDLIKASKNYIKYGDTKKLRKIGITFAPALFGMGGGGQISNLVDGIIADIEGEVRSARGRTLFDIKDLESQLKAPIFGVWSTKGGREYWERRQGKKQSGAFDFLDKKKSKGVSSVFDFLN